MPQINWLAMLAGTLTPMIIGFIYYHPKVFGTAWMTSLGMTPESAKRGNMGVIFGTAFVMAFLLSWFLLYNVDGPGQEGNYDSFKHGAFHGFELALLVAVPVMVTNGLFERKNYKNLLINAGYWLICLTLMGGVIDALNHWPDVWPAQ